MEPEIKDQMKELLNRINHDLSLKPMDNEQVDALHQLQMSLENAIEVF